MRGVGPPAATLTVIAEHAGDIGARSSPDIAARFL
jgi:hypothetical protein